MRTAAILPVAGLSSRMGDFKPLMSLNGFPMIRMAVQSVLDSGTSPVIVVTGREGERIRAALEGVTPPSPDEVRFVENPSFATTDMLCSIQLGLHLLLEEETQQGGSRVDAAFISPGDIPAISPKTFGALREQASSSGAPITVPRYHGQSGHPLLVRRECFEAICTYSGEGGLKKALETLGATFLDSGFFESNTSMLVKDICEIDDEGTLLDADDPTSFEKLTTFVRRTRGIAPELIDGLLDQHKTLPNIREHCAAVSALTARMVRHLNETGACLDSELACSAAALHDMNRLEHPHAQVAAENLRSLGYLALAQVVEGHQGFSAYEPSLLDEISIVCLADKLVKETRLVTLDERYAAALERYDEVSEVGRIVRRDLAYCYQLLAAYESRTGDVITPQ